MQRAWAEVRADICDGAGIVGTVHRARDASKATGNASDRVESTNLDGDAPGSQLKAALSNN